MLVGCRSRRIRVQSHSWMHTKFEIAVLNGDLLPSQEDPNGKLGTVACATPSEAEAGDSLGECLK